MTAGSYDPIVTISFIRNCQTVFQSDCYFALLPAMNENFCHSTFLPKLITLNFNHSNRYIVEYHFCFEFTMTTEHVFTCLFAIYMYLWWSVCADVDSFLIGLFVFLLGFKYSWHVLDTDPLSDMWLANRTWKIMH